jgi:hypothetical protein
MCKNLTFVCTVSSAHELQVEDPLFGSAGSIAVAPTSDAFLGADSRATLQLFRALRLNPITL